MKRFNWLIFLAFMVAGWAFGPIEQYAHYHHFADQTTWLGSANGKDVWSNVGFIGVGLWGMYCLKRQNSWHAIAWLTLLAMTLTGLGSAFYHLNPNDVTLVWDRLPISLTCAGLLACTWAYTQAHTGRLCDVLAVILAIFGVLVWHVNGDLRWYLGLQMWTMVMVPLWLWHAKAPRHVQAALGWAVAAYVLAKMTELWDAPIWMLSQHLISGHTHKHLLATVAMAAMAKAIVHMAVSLTLNANADHFANRKFGWPVCRDQSDLR